MDRVLVKVAGNVEYIAELSYYHHDNLGSTMLMTDAAGQQVFKQDYAPFGQTLYGPGLTQAPMQLEEPGFKYTGQREDAGTGLYYYNARYYDPETGRFTREDEYQGDLGRPQTLNLYIYTVNNSLKYIDSTGHSYEDAIKLLIQEINHRNFCNVVDNGIGEPLSSNHIKARDELAKSKNSTPVAIAQASLNILGYKTGGVDGAKGPLTDEALRNVQKAFGLPLSAQLDEKTMVALDLAVRAGLNMQEIEEIGVLAGNIRIMKISEAGLEFIKNYETFRANTYIDAAGYPTIGYGHKIENGEVFEEPMSHESALELLRTDIQPKMKVVNEYVEVALTQNQFDALVSFSFNNGVRAFKESTLLRKINQSSSSDEILAAFRLFIKGRDQKTGEKIVLKGLVARRNDEFEIYNIGEYDREYDYSR